MSALCRCCMVVILAAMAGCSKPVQHSDDAELGLPMMVKAKDLEQAGKVDEAKRIYEVLLEKHPDMARAHLGLAFLMDRPGDDRIQALYHYQRYLDLRPDTQKRKMIDARVKATKAVLVGASGTNEPSMSKRKLSLERENEVLKVRNANLETQLVRSQKLIRSLQSPQGQVGKPKQVELPVGPAVAGIQPAVRTVRVQKSDTLRRIAERVYGDQHRWQEIYECNRNLLKAPEDVRVGQVLVVPE